MEQKSRRRSVDAQRPVEAAKGKLSVSVVRVKSRHIVSQDNKDEEFDSEIFLTDPAYVRVAHGATKSIGDFESLRVDVAVTMPCYKERVEACALSVGEQVALMLQKELDEYGVSLS